MMSTAHISVSIASAYGIDEERRELRRDRARGMHPGSLPRRRPQVRRVVDLESWRLGETDEPVGEADPHERTDGQMGQAVRGDVESARRGEDE